MAMVSISQKKMVSWRNIVIIGLHDYLPQNVWLDIVNNPFHDFITYEDIFIREKKLYTSRVRRVLDDNFEYRAGSGCREDTLSSATTPSGISALLARRYVNFTAE